MFAYLVKPTPARPSHGRHLPVGAVSIASALLAFPLDDSMQRKDSILAAAGEHFGRYGFHGASLRNIARDAGVSLTLLHHHFDNKLGLLAAVVELNRPLLRQRHDVVKRLRSLGLGVFQPSDLVRAWVTMAFDAAAHPEGLRFLRLLARMQDDGSEEATIVRRPLQEAADAFVDALQCCYPGASRRAAVSSYQCVVASMLRILTSEELEMDLEDPARLAIAALDRRRIERFLVAGIEAALCLPEPAIEEARSDKCESARSECKSRLAIHS